MIHLTSTGLDSQHYWWVVCRCGRQADGFSTRDVARQTGNAHIDFAGATHQGKVAGRRWS